MPLSRHETDMSHFQNYSDRLYPTRFDKNEPVWLRYSSTESKPLIIAKIDRKEYDETRYQLKRDNGDIFNNGEWYTANRLSPRGTPSLSYHFHRFDVNYKEASVKHWLLPRGIFLFCQTVHDLDSTLVITKIWEHCYEARTVSVSLEKYFPQFGTKVLDWLSTPFSVNMPGPLELEIEELPIYPADSMSYQTIFIDIGGSTAASDISIKVTSESSRLVNNISDALIWIAGTIQDLDDTPYADGHILRQALGTWSSTGKLTLSHVPYTPPVDGPYCWLKLFDRILMSPDFTRSQMTEGERPAVDYEQRRGLEIDFSILLQLAAIDSSFGTGADKDFALVGFDTALIPLEPPHHRRWHFVTTRGKQITPARLKKAYSGERLIPRRRFIEEYCGGTVFVGWCESPEVLIATALPSKEIAIKVMKESSGLPIAELEERSDRSNATEAAFQPRFGFLGNSFGLSLSRRKGTTFRQVNVRGRLSVTENFARMVLAASSQDCILWDQTSKRAYLLSSVLVLLFATFSLIEARDYGFQQVIRSCSDCSLDGDRDAIALAVKCLRANRPTKRVEDNGAECDDGDDAHLEKLYEAYGWACPGEKTSA